MNVSTTPTLSTPSKCCGCCCDYRRAVITVDIVIIAFEALLLIGLASDAYSYFLLYNDDGIATTEMIFSAVSIVTGFVSIYGACIFNIWPVVVNVAWLLIGYIATLIVVAQYCSNDFIPYDYYDPFYGDWYTVTGCTISPGNAVIQAILMLLWMYPHIGFMVQVWNGSLAKDNYIPQSCCCTGNAQQVGHQAEQTIVVTQKPHPQQPTVVVTQAYPYQKPQQQNWVEMEQDVNSV